MTSVEIGAAQTEPTAGELIKKLSCEAGEDYYRGGYYDSGDSGKILGCSQGPSELIGRYVSDIDGHGGSFDIRLTSSRTWSGTYQDDGKQPGTWSGTFYTHFKGDGCCGAVTAITPADLLNNIQYRTFFGLDDPTYTYREWARATGLWCSDVVSSATGFPGVDVGGEIPAETTFGQHSASVFGNSDFHDLLDSSLPPSDLAGNVFVDATAPYAPALKAAIENSDGNLAPADVLVLALKATGGDYSIAALTSLIVLKEVSFQGRDAAGLMSRLAHAHPTGDAALALEDNLFQEQSAVLEVQDQVVGKLISLRMNGRTSLDKMGPWYHAFTILTVGALYPVPIPAGHAAAFWEHFRKVIGAFSTSEAAYNDEKATLDFCFAGAADSSGLRELSQPQA